MRENKNDVIQIMRGIAIIVVLIRHAIAQVNADVFLSNIESIIICFHMPAFFMIAGYLFQGQIEKYRSMSESRFLAGKAKRLLIPYVFWTVFLWFGVQVACALSPAILSMMTDIGFAPMSVGNLVYGLLTYQIYYTEHLWFLYVLFLLFAINIFTQKIGASVYSAMTWFFIGFIILFVNLPHIVERTMLWGIFFELGRLSNKKNIPEKITGGGYTIAVCILFVVSSYIRITSLNAELSGKWFGILMQFDKYLIGLSGVILIWALARIFARWNRVQKVLKTIGDYSFDIYLMHNPYFVALSAIVLNKLLELDSYVTIIISTFLGVVIPMLVSRFVIRRVKWLSALMVGRS